MKKKLMVGVALWATVLGACNAGKDKLAGQDKEAVNNSPAEKEMAGRQATNRLDPVWKLIDKIQSEQDPGALRTKPIEQALRYDLNGNKKPESIVLVGGIDWCKKGCSLLVINEDDTNPKILAELKVAQGPIMVTEVATNGWLDLITTSADKSRKRWKWDGEKYVADPKTVDLKNLGAGLTVFANKSAPPEPTSVEAKR